MEKKSIFVKFDDNQLKYENHQTSRMSTDSSMGTTTSNTADATSQNDINDAPWSPVEDVLPVESVPEVKPVEPVQEAEPVQEHTQEQTEEPVQEQTQEALSTSITNLRVEIPEPSESDDDMPPLISSSDYESDSDSNEETSDSKDDSEESEEESEEISDESKDPDEDLMVAVFQRPTCQRCDAALKALLTPSEDESETETSSDSSDSPRTHRIRPKPTEIPTIIITLFKILLFLHVVQFLTTTFAPARRTYS